MRLYEVVRGQLGWLDWIAGGDASKRDSPNAI